MISFKTYLEEATAEQDKFFRDMAENIAKKIINTFNKADNNILVYHPIEGGPNHGLNEQIMFLELDKIPKLSKEQKSLLKDWNFIVSPQKFNKSIAGSASHVHQYIKLIISDKLAKEVGMDYLENNGRISKSLFKKVGNEIKKSFDIMVHEFIHRLDFARFKGDISKFISSGYYYAKGDMVGYFNHSHELNAFFQQVISSINNSLKIDLKSFKTKLSAQEALVNKLWEFSTRSEINFNMITYIENVKTKHHGWMYLTDKNKKRIKKRIYEYLTKTMPDRYKKEVEKLDNENFLYSGIKENLKNPLKTLEKDIDHDINAIVSILSSKYKWMEWVEKNIFFSKINLSSKGIKNYENALERIRIDIIKRFHLNNVYFDEKGNLLK